MTVWSVGLEDLALQRVGFVFACACAVCAVCVVGFFKVLLSKSLPFPFVGLSPGNAFSKCYLIIRAALMLSGSCLKLAYRERI